MLNFWRSKLTSSNSNSKMSRYQKELLGSKAYHQIMFRVSSIRFVIWPMRAIWIVIQVKRFWNIKRNGLSSSMSRCRATNQITLVRDLSRSALIKLLQPPQLLWSSRWGSKSKRLTGCLHRKLFIRIWMLATIGFLKYPNLLWLTPCKIWILRLSLTTTKSTFIISIVENTPKTLSVATVLVKLSLRKTARDKFWPTKDWKRKKTKSKMKKLKKTLGLEIF